MMTDFESKRRQTALRLGLKPEALPRHIAIIMDGNGRWATQRGLPRFRGHEQGGKTVETIAKYCVDIGLEVLTIYSFSMQNWKRPKEEIDFLMYLYAAYLEGIRPMLMENNVRLVHLGTIRQLPQKVVDALEETKRLTAGNTGMVLCLALNYGGREEIVQAVQRIAEKCRRNLLEPEKIDEACISNHLYTAGCPDPDLVIRTSGELRISNFLLWQISYAEFYVTETFWPDFTPADLDKALTAFAGRSRRFGDIRPSGA
ncbi:MAG TPA: isoprenyl transferase [Anaerohalosphaeraceae bacterium]|nr:isoprenyl transferase [Anaerohalosphaeraceae bacterium]HOL88783.1 isoprenyl transferase [Anaerohalosphaeraceae bacterium]HPP55968.1 isoprenyl transferase [Anaerohalosphaeraceae bacterium]